MGGKYVSQRSFTLYACVWNTLSDLGLLCDGEVKRSNGEPCKYMTESYGVKHRITGEKEMEQHVLEREKTWETKLLSETHMSPTFLASGVKHTRPSKPFVP